MSSNKPKVIAGGALRPSAAIQMEYQSAILALVRRMCDETKRELKQAFEDSDELAMAADAAPSAPGSPSKVGMRYRRAAPKSQAAINALMDKWVPEFGRIARRATKRMVARMQKNSSVTLGLSLREMSEKLKLNTDTMTEGLQDVISASTAEAVGLIKLIPQKYLTEVQGAVSRSIVNGNGLQDLVPFLNKKYDQNIRHARNVAMDQTRKVYSGLTSARMQAAGITEYTWVHVGGSMEPRQRHLEMDDKVFSLAEPPVIGEMYGQKVRGKPGDLPNCRCVMRPVIKFEG